MAKIIIILHIFVNIIIAAKDYGYFGSKLNSLKTCQGPKRKDCCITNVNVQSEDTAIYDVNCMETVTPTKAKIIASAKNRQQVRLQMDKPCSHVFIKPIIVSLFNASKDCTVAKNQYHVSLNHTELAQRYYNGMFLYGNWSFQASLYNDQCNFLCIKLELNMFPKK